MFVDDTNPGPLFFDAAGAKPPSLGDFERFGSPRIGGWGAVRHLYHSLEYLVLARFWLIQGFAEPGVNFLRCISLDIHLYVVPVNRHGKKISVCV
jgi:hypothetical protein